MHLVSDIWFLLLLLLLVVRFKTVEWNYGAGVDAAMLQMVGDTLVDLKVIDKTPPSEALIAAL